MLIVSVLFACKTLAADVPGPKPHLLASFEPGEKKVVDGQGTIVKEHASDGEYSIRLENPGHGYVGISISNGATLRLFKDYALLRLDVFNPQDRPVRCTMRVDDTKSHDYGSRYNDDGVIVRPGASTLQLNLTGLTRSNARNFTQREKLDLSSLRMWGVSFVAKERTVLFIDNIRLEGSGLPEVAGLRAFDMGPSGSPVYPGFEAVTEKSVYTPAAGFGWVGPGRHDNVYTPDALTGDYGSGDQFRVDLPNGQYEIHTCIDTFGTFAAYPTFSWRRLKINGVEVLNETRSAAEFLDRYYFSHEDEEDLPGLDAWEKFVAPRNVVRKFEATVTDGSLKIVPQSNAMVAITFVVVYPKSQEQAGRQFMEQLQSRRKQQFNSWLIVRVPQDIGAAPAASAADVSRGFIPFVRKTQIDVPVTAKPLADEIGKPMVIEAAKGERGNAVLGLYPLSEVAGVSVKPSELAGPGGSMIPASAISVRKIRNFLRRTGQTPLADIEPRILQEFASLDLRPGVTRGLWVKIAVPSDAAPGEYRGKIVIGAGAKSAEVPVLLTVFPFTLDKITDTTLSVTGATPARWRNSYPQLEDIYWNNAELVMKDMADHGMNAVTGGPGAHLKSVKDGKPEIDFTDMDRWLALAVKYGLTLPGDSYQGLDIAGLPHHRGPDAVEACEKEAQRKFGIGFAELIHIVYADVARHAKEKGWPPRVYSLLDEPRPEYHNVDSAIQIAKLFVDAAPETLFSGYFSTGGGREPLFQIMPVAICHTNDMSVQLTHDAGKQLWDYSGGGARYDIGRWAFYASRRGLKGFMRNGYMYVCSDPYFDFSDDEASWCVVYPSRHGVNDTVGWERTAQGVDDFRYLATLERLIREAKAAHQREGEASAAEAFLNETFKNIKLDDKKSADLTPQQFDEFRRAIARHIAALMRE